MAKCCCIKYNIKLYGIYFKYSNDTLQEKQLVLVSFKKKMIKQLLLLKLLLLKIKTNSIVTLCSCQMLVEHVHS